MVFGLVIFQGLIRVYALIMVFVVDFFLGRVGLMHENPIFGAGRGKLPRPPWQDEVGY